MNEISALHIFSGVSKPEAYLRHENEHTHKLDAVACWHVQSYFPLRCTCQKKD